MSKSVGFRRSAALLLLMLVCAGCAQSADRPGAIAPVRFEGPSELAAQGQHAAAEAAYRAILADERALRGKGVASRIAASTGLAEAIGQQGKSAIAEPMLREALALAEAQFGAEHIVTANVQSALARTLLELKDLSGAEALHRHSLATHRRHFGTESIEAVDVGSQLAIVLMELARYDEAEPLFRERLRRFALTKDADPVDIAPTENNLAALLGFRGRFAEAEPLYRSALRRWQEKYGENHPYVGSAYNNVASNLEEQGRTDEAIQLYRRALDVTIATVGNRHPMKAVRLNNLAGLLNQVGRSDEALAMFNEAIAIWTAAYGPEYPSIAASSINIATLLIGQDKIDEAEPYLVEALRITRKAFGERHPRTADAISSLAGLKYFQLKFAEALPLYIQSRDLVRDSLGTGNAEYAMLEDALARTYNQLEKFEESEAASRAALHATRQARALLTGSASVDLAKNSGGDLAPEKVYFGRYLTFGKIQTDGTPAQASEIDREGFIAMQDMLGWSAGQEVVQAAARRSVDSPALSALLRKQQDLVGVARNAEAAQLAALSAARPDAARAEQARYDGALRELAEIEARLGREFPTYRSLSTSDGLSIEAARAQLAEGEALLVAGLNEFELHSFLVTRRGVRWLTFDHIDKVRDWIARLRCDVDIESCPHDLVVERRRDLFAAGSDEARFDYASAYNLYEAIFKPLERDLKGIDRLYVVADPELRDFSMAMLVTRKSDVAAARLDRAHWLADRFALTYLPSVASLTLDRGQRQFMNDTLLGYGDPLLNGKESADNITGFASSNSRGAFVANRDELDKLSPLPGTRIELEAMGALFDTGQATIRLGPAATERNLRADQQLASANVIAFATHALLPNPGAGIEEPGLVMSPPASSSEADDGFLAASEVAGLSLHAQWVILSACNTASSGKGSNGLSALARAFLYAGAEALLASHWRVSDESTAVLTAETLRHWKSDKGMTRAQALQSAMRAVRTGKRADGSKIEGWNADWAHPAAWAPFTITANRSR